MSLLNSSLQPPGDGDKTDPSGSNQPSTSAFVTTGGAGSRTAALDPKSQRYEDIIKSLQKLLEAERKRTKQVRSVN